MLSARQSFLEKKKKKVKNGRRRFLEKSIGKQVIYFRNRFPRIFFFFFFFLFGGIFRIESWSLI